MHYSSYGIFFNFKVKLSFANLDTEGGSKYLYKAPRGLQVKNKCSSFEGDSGPFSGRRPSEQRVEPRREAPMVVHGLDQEYHQAAIAPHGLDQDPQEAPLTACGLDQSHGMTFAGSASGGHSVPRTVHHQTDNMDMSYEVCVCVLLFLCVCVCVCVCVCW